MTVRRGSKQRGSWDSVVADLPDRFRDVEVVADAGSMTGLAGYIQDLTSHLQSELGSVSQPQVMDVMSSLGIAPSEWYGALLTACT